MSTLPPRVQRYLVGLWLLAAGVIGSHLAMSTIGERWGLPIVLIALLMAALDQVAVTVPQVDGETHIIALNDAAIAIGVLIIGGDAALAIALGIAISELGIDRLRGVRRIWFRTLTNMSSVAIQCGITAGAVAGIDHVWAGTALQQPLAIMLAGAILSVSPKIAATLLFRQLTGESVSTVLRQLLAESQLYASVALIVGLLAAACLRIVGVRSVEIVGLVLVLGLGLIALARSSIQLIADLEHRVAARTAELATANGELARVMEARAREYRAIAHDFRGPIAAAANSLEMVQDYAHDPRSSSLIANAHQTLRQVMTHVNQLLDIAKMERETLTLTLAPADIGAMVRDTVAMLSTRFTIADCALTVTIPAAPIMLETDAVRVQRTIINVLENALRYTITSDVDSPAVTIVLSDNGDGVAIAVSDNGRGIAAADIDRIGTEFVRIKTDDGTNGSGIGLAYVRRILAQLGGQLTLASPGVGCGTTATIILTRRT